MLDTFVGGTVVVVGVVTGIGVTLSWLIVVVTAAGLNVIVVVSILSFVAGLPMVVARESDLIVVATSTIGCIVGLVCIAVLVDFMSV